MEQTVISCPFCGSHNIDYSVKTTGRWKRQYHLALYCKECNCYGKRVLITPAENESRFEVERNPKYKQLAIDAWNNRQPFDEVIDAINQELNMLAQMRQESYKKGDYSRSDRAAERLCEAQFCKRIIEEKF
jgi:hypothetical protein